MGKPLLTLTTAFDRPTVRIDGVDYELMERGDLGILDQVRIWQTYGRIAQVRAKTVEEIGETDQAVLTEALATVLAIVLPGLPAAVRTRLREEQQLQILESFYTAEEETAAPLPPADPPTTGSCSPG